jgi:uncharacterized membrane protein
VAQSLLWLVILAFVVTFAGLALRRHWALATNGMDLGNVNQALWNTAQGNFLAFTNMAPVQNRLALHVEPILLLLVPLYWLGLGGPVALLIIQAAVVGLGALPMYWLARDSLLPLPPGPRPAEPRMGAQVFLPLIFPLTYLLLPALEAAVLYDFHAVTLAPTWLLFAFHYLQQRRYCRSALFALLAMACKEDMALVVAMLGLHALLAPRRAAPGQSSGTLVHLTTFVAGLVWFAVALLVVQPAFSPTGGNVQGARYAWLGEDPWGVLDTFLRRPGLVWDHLWRQADLPGYLAGLLLPTAGLGILSPLTWLPTLPSLAINLLSNDPFTWRLEAFHYAAPIAPFAVLAALYGMGTLLRFAARHWPGATRVVAAGLASLLLIATLTYHWGRGFSPLARPFQAWPATAHTRLAATLFGQVPESAALFAQSNLNPHVSGRRVLYQSPEVLTNLLDDDGNGVGGNLPAPEYLLFDVATLVNKDDFQTRVVSTFLERGYQPLAATDGFLLLRAAPGEPSRSGDDLPDSFYTFALAGDTRPNYPMVVDFDSTLRLVGFDLVFNRAEEVQPVLTFEALRSPDEDLFLALYLLDEWGTLRGATLNEQPVTVWYPTHRWQPGERVRVTFNTLSWYTGSLPGYRLAVGVLHGRDPWQAPARLTPRPVDDLPYAVRLPADGSLAELARVRQDVFGMPWGSPVERHFSAPQNRQSLDVSFGDQIQLLGYRARPVRCDDEWAGDTGCWVGVTLYWQARRAPLPDYTVFTHVVERDGSSEIGRIRAQRDVAPDAGAYPTSRWVTGEVVEDAVRIDLPADLPAGSYDLVVGLYDPLTGRRLPVLDRAGGVVDDSVVLRGIVRVP